MSILNIDWVIEHMAQGDNSKLVKFFVIASKVATLILVFGVSYFMYTDSDSLGQFGDILLRLSLMLVLFAMAFIGVRAVSRSQKKPVNQIVLKLLLLFLVLPALITVLLFVSVWIFNPQP